MPGNSAAAIVVTVVASVAVAVAVAAVFVCVFAVVVSALSFLVTRGMSGIGKIALPLNATLAFVNADTNTAHTRRSTDRSTACVSCQSRSRNP